MKKYRVIYKDKIDETVLADCKLRAIQIAWKQRTFECDIAPPLDHFIVTEIT